MTADDDDGQLQRVISEITTVVHSLGILLQLLLILLPLLVRLAQVALFVVDATEAIWYGMTHAGEGWGMFWFRLAWNYEKNIN